MGKHILKSGIKGLLISLIVATIGWLIFSFHLNQSPIETLFQPIQVAFVGFDQRISRGDLFTILGFLKGEEHGANVATAVYTGFYLDMFRVIILMIVSFYLAKDISKTNDRMQILSMLLIANLFTFPHLMYDFLVLLPSFVYSFSNRRLIHAKFSLVISNLYFFFPDLAIIEF